MTVTRHTRYEDLPELLTVKELRAWLGLGRNSSYEILKQLHPIKIGRLLRVPRTALQRLISASPGPLDEHTLSHSHRSK